MFVCLSLALSLSVTLILHLPLPLPLGNLFVDPKQRPQDYDDYQWTVINLTRAANELLPRGAPRYQVLRYVDMCAPPRSVY